MEDGRLALSRKSFRALKAARLAEIQAIAIYQAELVFTHSSERRRLLLEIYEEECAHDRDLEEFVVIGPFSTFLNRIAGWVFGSFLGILPWRVLCRIQAWAEAEAARIYERAFHTVLEECAKSGRSCDERLEMALTQALSQERRHSKRFQ